MDNNVVVIGSGAAGLSAAAHLSLEGFDVVVLEQAPHIGGLLHPFVRDGFEFDPGLHYIGRAAPGQQMGLEMERLGLDPNEVFAPMDDDFDVYRFGDFEIAMCSELERYRVRLADAFPNDVAGVDRVIGAVEHLSAAMELQRPGRHALREYFEAAGAIPLARWMNATFEEYLDWACTDERLKAVFAASCGDYGLPPSRSSAAMGLAVLSHYATGAYFPRGGAGAFRDRLRGVAEDHGAQFHPSCAVRHITTAPDGAFRIESETGARFLAAGVVCAIDPRYVYGQLLDPALVPHKVLKRLPDIESSLSACVLYLGLERDLRVDGWGAFNVWDYPNWDIESVYRPPLAGEFGDEMSFFISPNSLKDPTGRMAPEGCSTVEVLTAGPWKAFEKWADAGEEGRFELHRFKVDLQARIMGQLEAKYPELVSSVRVAELSTPLAFHHHVRAIDGGLYGPAHTPEQSMANRFAPTTHIDGLVLAGQGVFGCGVTTAMFSGRVSASILAKHLT